MDRELLISAGSGEWRAALLEDGVPVELYVERGDRIEAGSIHVGRVRRLVPALGAALVDIGDDRPAFLPQGEVEPRGHRLNEGERVLVQIRREAQGGKAARATMRVRLRAPAVELIVGRPGLHGGEELAPDERNQLLAAIDTLTHPGLGPGSTLPRIAGEGADPRILVRGKAGEGAVGLRIIETAGIGALTSEAAGLGSHWRDILDRAARLEPPARLSPVATFAAALASAVPGPPAQVGVDDPGATPDIRAAFPGSAVEHRPEAEWPIDLDAVFDQALSETVTLVGGGSVHIEATRAAVLIDVDTGTPDLGSPESSGLKANLAGAVTIARQVRLRNLGGGIVVDFVGLDRKASRERVRAALADAIASDPAAPQLLGWTRLGHLELVRPRRGRPLADALVGSRGGSAAVKTPVTVAHEALRALRREAQAQPGRRWRLIVAPDVAAVLATSVKAAVQITQQRFARQIEIEADSANHRERFQITPL